MQAMLQISLLFPSGIYKPNIRKVLVAIAFHFDLPRQFPTGNCGGWVWRPEVELLLPGGELSDTTSIWPHGARSADRL